MSIKKVFVTGGTGFLGINLIDELLKTNQYEITALHRKGSDLSHLKKRPVHLVEGSLLDPEQLATLIPDQTSYLFHVAANTNMWSLQNPVQTRDNVEGTRNIVQAALKKNVGRFIHTSSIAAYGIYDGVKIDESQPSNAKDSWINYIKSKYLAEMEVQVGIESGLDAVFLNPSNIMGPYDTHNWSTLIRLIVSKKLPAIPSGSGSFCHVREVAKAHISAATNGRTGERYLLGGTDASYQDLVEEVNKLTGNQFKPRILPVTFMKLYGQISQAISLISRKKPEVTPEMVHLTSSRMICSSDKAQKELGYQPVSLKNMVTDCYQWMQKEQYI